MTTANREGSSEFGDILDIRLEGLTLRVADVGRSIEFYGNTLGFTVEINKAPQFAMMRVGGPDGRNNRPTTPRRTGCFRIEERDGSAASWHPR